MKELVIIKSGNKQIYHLPETIKEMTGKQIMEAIKYRADKMAGNGFNPYLTTLCGINKQLIPFLSKYHIYKLEQCFEYILSENWEEDFTEQKFKKILIGETEFHGYLANFGNTTWEEFIWADQLFINKDYKRLIACLYREKREKYNGETDIRIPFTNYGMEKRFQIVKTLDEATITALAFQYRAMRKASLETKYTQIFQEAVKYESEETQPEPEPEPDNFSWVKVHQNIMGDNIQNEKEYLNLSVHTVLNRLNTVIENKKKKK